MNQPKELGTLVLLDNKGNETSCHSVPDTYQLSWEKIVALYPHQEGSTKKHPRVLVPEKHAVVEIKKHRKKMPMMCGYNATEDYVNSLLGVKLCYADREFYMDHPLTEQDGLPTADTLRVTQELVAPYGLRISRVRVQQGLHLTGDLRQWRKVLGINPKARQDRVTTNAEFAEQMGLPLEQVNEQYRFEFNTECLHPSIACGVVTNGVTVTGSTGGHATYEAPRSKRAAAILSFQLDRGVAWKREPVWEPLEDEAKTYKEFNLPKFKTPDGKHDIMSVDEKGEPYSSRGYVDWRRGGEEWNGATWVKSGSNTAKDWNKCPGCGGSLYVSSNRPVCISCWSSVWTGYSCYQCKGLFSEDPPNIVGRVEKRGVRITVRASCTHCKVVNTLDSKDDGRVALLYYIARGTPNQKQVRKWKEGLAVIRDLEWENWEGSGEF